MAPRYTATAWIWLSLLFDTSLRNVLGTGISSAVNQLQNFQEPGYEEQAEQTVTTWQVVHSCQESRPTARRLQNSNEYAMEGIELMEGSYYTYSKKGKDYYKSAKGSPKGPYPSPSKSAKSSKSSKGSSKEYYDCVDLLEATVYNAYIISNAVGLSAEDLTSGLNRHALDLAYSTYIDVQFDGFFTSPLGRALKKKSGYRKLLRGVAVTDLLPYSSVNYQIDDFLCPPGIVASCQKVYARFKIRVDGIAEPQVIADGLEVYTQGNIANEVGGLNSYLVAIYPGADIRVVASSVPLTPKPMNPTPPPVPEIPTPPPIVPTQKPTVDLPRNDTNIVMPETPQPTEVSISATTPPTTSIASTTPPTEPLAPPEIESESQSAAPSLPITDAPTTSSPLSATLTAPPSTSNPISASLTAPPTTSSPISSTIAPTNSTDSDRGIETSPPEPEIASSGNVTESVNATEPDEPESEILPETPFSIQSELLSTFLSEPEPENAPLQLEDDQEADGSAFLSPAYTTGIAAAASVVAVVLMVGVGVIVMRRRQNAYDAIKSRGDHVIGSSNGSVVSETMRSTRSEKSKDYNYNLHDLRDAEETTTIRHGDSSAESWEMRR